MYLCLLSNKSWTWEVIITILNWNFLWKNKPLCLYLCQCNDFVFFCSWNFKRKNSENQLKFMTNQNVGLTDQQHETWQHCRYLLHTSNVWNEQGHIHWWQAYHVLIIKCNALPKATSSSFGNLNLIICAITFNAWKFPLPVYRGK
jgi:hypothetical protein